MAAGYSVDGLKHGIERCHVNIGVLKQAIQKERATIKEYEKMIRSIAETKANVAARDKFISEHPDGKIDARDIS